MRQSAAPSRLIHQGSPCGGLAVFLIASLPASCQRLMRDDPLRKVFMSLPIPPLPKPPCSCTYCGESFESRNKLYRHLRETQACGRRAVSDGLDIETGRPQRRRKVVLNVAYGPPVGGGERAEAMLLQQLVQMEGLEGKLGDLTLMRASDHTFRRSLLLRNSIPALEDVFIFRSCHTDERLDAELKESWLTDINGALQQQYGLDAPHVLDRELLDPSFAQLNAEQHASARVYECLLPLSYLTNDPPERGGGEQARKLKEILRSLCSPKSATSGGFRHRQSSTQRGWRSSLRWHNFANGKVVPTDLAAARMVDRFFVAGEWSCALGSERRCVRLKGAAAEVQLLLAVASVLSVKRSRALPLTADCRACTDHLYGCTWRERA